jgi:hypothetical protein
LKQQRVKKSIGRVQPRRDERYCARVRSKVVSWLCGLALASACGSAEATELVFRAPARCESAESIREQVERLIERPLSEAHGADFEVTVEQTSEQRFRARVRTKPRNDAAAASEREFSAKTCGEVSDAAAVAIAMAIEQQEQAEARATSETSSEPKQPALATAPAPADRPPALAKPNGHRFRAFVGVQGALEDGALPNPSPGAELDLSAGFGAFHATVLGALLAPQTKRRADGTGGEFQLMLLGLLACGNRSLGPVNGRGCVGFELGQLSAEGVGVVDPRLGNGAWRAARVDLGLGWPLVTGLSVTLRGALVAPLTRQTFVLNGSDRVFRPSSFGVRGLLGVELEI